MIAILSAVILGVLFIGGTALLVGNWNRQKNIILFAVGTAIGVIAASLIIYRIIHP